MPFVSAGGHRLEYEWVGLGDAAAPVVVLLHQGLGSVALWRDFPRAVHEATGLRVLVYSRWGYGKSEPLARVPHGADFLRREAASELPDLLRALGVAKPVLLGHSDGGSIALVYAGRRIAPEPLAVLCMAPHVMLEKESIVSLAKARLAYEEGDLKAKLARFHDDVDSAFYGWNVTWLMPDMRAWSIEGELAGIRCPLAVLQGEADEYGTAAQLESIKRHTGGKAEVTLLENCGHSPHIDQRARVLGALKRLLAAIKVPA
jgi:pimeloyl-ACP methyl ester carboxylesterase